VLVERISDVTREDVAAVADGIEHAVTYFLTDNRKDGEGEGR
jgi:hypothetical protein